MSFAAKSILGRSEISVGRLGISSSYRAPAAAYEEAFERGCNYFSWGTFIKGRSTAMRQAIRTIVAKGKRSELVLGMLTYAHSAWLTEVFLRRGLKALGTDYVDVLLLGYFPKRPPQRVLEGAWKLKRSGLVRTIGLTSHNRKVFAQLDPKDELDVFHVRYNAAHRGAEREVFPQLGNEGRAGLVSFTATCWGRLLDPRRMPPQTEPPSAADCYRFVLSHPSVDVCMVGARTHEQMKQALAVLESAPMNDEELTRMRAIGDFVYKTKRK